MSIEGNYKKSVDIILKTLHAERNFKIISLFDMKEDFIYSLIKYITKYHINRLDKRMICSLIFSKEINRPFGKENTREVRVDFYIKYDFFLKENLTVDKFNIDIIYHEDNTIFLQSDYVYAKKRFDITPGEREVFYRLFKDFIDSSIIRIEKNYKFDSMGLIKIEDYKNNKIKDILFKIDVLRKEIKDLEI